MRTLNVDQNLLRIIGQPPLKCHCKECEPGMIFECDLCGRLMPWCMGAADDMVDSCDDCWAKAHRFMFTPPTTKGGAA